MNQIGRSGSLFRRIFLSPTGVRLAGNRLSYDFCRRTGETGHKALIRWIGTLPHRVVYEPTGPYHRKLEVALAAAQMPIVKVNPRQARRFAEATGVICFCLIVAPWRDDGPEN